MTGVIRGLLSPRSLGVAIRRVATLVAVFAPTTPPAFGEGGNPRLEILPGAFPI
jgi:hypothetical protein